MSSITNAISSAVGFHRWRVWVPAGLLWLCTVGHALAQTDVIEEVQGQPSNPLRTDLENRMDSIVTPGHRLFPFAAGNQRRPHRRVPVNPLAIQQGLANFAFHGDRPYPRHEAGFPLNLVPPHWIDRIPKLDFSIHTPQGRHQGVGQPLTTTSWRNRPLYFDAFSGGLFGSELVSGTADQGNGIITGGRLGWDVSHYWGGEFRFAAADTAIIGTNNRADIRFWDLNILYYPWGDTRVRPYTSLGLGVAEFSLIDSTGLGINEATVHLPITIGVKYYVRRWFSIRAELSDNISFGSSTLRTMHNISLTGGLELRFGGRRRSYFPFNSSIRLR